MKSEMCNVGGRDVEGGRQKRVCPPGDGSMMPRSKRTALGDVTNNVSMAVVIIESSASLIPSSWIRLGAISKHPPF